MFEMPMQAMMIASQTAVGMPAASQIQSVVFNAADLDLGYEVAFPFLTADEVGSSAVKAALS